MYINWYESTEISDDHATANIRTYRGTKIIENNWSFTSMLRYTTPFTSLQLHQMEHKICDSLTDKWHSQYVVQSRHHLSDEVHRLMYKEPGTSAHSDVPSECM